MEVFDRVELADDGKTFEFDSLVFWLFLLLKKHTLLYWPKS